MKAVFGLCLILLATVANVRGANIFFAGYPPATNSQLQITASVDNTPPEVTLVSCTPPEIGDNTLSSNTPRTVTCRLEGIDPGTPSSGVSLINVTFQSPDGQRKITCIAFQSPDNCTMTFPRYGATGLWTLSSVLINDRARNYAMMDREQAAAKNFFREINIVGTADTEAPNLYSFSASPLSLSVSGTSHSTFTMSLNCTDNLSGCKSGVAAFTSPIGSAQSIVKLLNFNVVTPAAGTTNMQQTSSSIFAFEGALSGGAWTLAYVRLTDGAGNAREFSATQLQSLARPANANSVTVTQPTPGQVVDAPYITDFAFAPTQIDVTNNQEPRVCFNITMEGDIQNIGGNVYFQGPGPKNNYFTVTNLRGCGSSCSEELLPSGNRRYTRCLLFTDWDYVNGVYSMTGMTIRDQAGNTRTYGRCNTDPQFQSLSPNYCPGSASRAVLSVAVLALCFVASLLF